MFNTSRNLVASLSVKAMQVCPRNKWRSTNSLKLNSSRHLSISFNKWRSADSLKLNSSWHLSIALDTSRWLSIASLIASIYRGLKSCFNSRLDSCSIDRVSIEIYEIRIFRFDFWPILTCMCRVSFLTTRDIYKEYFKGRHIREYKVTSALFSP